MTFSSNSSQSASTPTKDRRTSFVLFGIIALCILLIGLTSYIKFELDLSEAALAAPEILLSPEQQTIDSIRRNLGYAGFLGSAQNYAVSHDAAQLAEMKAQLQQANEGLQNLPAKTSEETRRALQSIVGVNDAVMQKADKTSQQSPADFTAQDVAPLYSAIPILDANVSRAIAANRTIEHSHIQFWAMMQTIINWLSLLIASGLAAGIYFVMRDRNSAPMRALAQSVKNMARGDMRTSIWGMERQDAIGELARSVDMARFHFSQLPDMSLLSEQGPVRIRFEGNTRSLFEAMMRVISRDSEQVHEQATILTHNVQKHQEALAQVVNRVESVLQSVEARAVNGDQQVRQALQNMLGSAESLKNAQEHAADQLNRIIPFLQERTQGIGEIAQIAGKQVAQALQALSSSERGLRASAENSEAAIQKFSSAADTLGERMFGAVNLLQASGKVLTETSASMQSRMDEAIERIIAAGGVPTPVATDLNPETAKRFGAIVQALETSQANLQQLLNEQAETAKAHIGLLVTQSSSLLSQTATSSQTLSAASDRLRDEQAKMEELLNKLVEFTQPQTPAPMALEPGATEAIVAPLLVDIRNGFTSIEQRFSELHEHANSSSQSILLASDRMSAENNVVREMLHKASELMAQPLNIPTIEDIAAPLVENMRQGFTYIDQRVAALQETNATHAQHLTETAARMGEILAKTNDLISRPVPMPPASAEAIAAPVVENLHEGFASIERRFQTLHDELVALAAKAAEPPPMPHDMSEQMRDQWFQMAGQIEASRSNLAQFIAQQTEKVEAQISELGHSPSQNTNGDDAQFIKSARVQLEQQTHILGELVHALSLLDAHMQDIRGQMTARQRAS